MTFISCLLVLFRNCLRRFSDRHGRVGGGAVHQMTTTAQQHQQPAAIVVSQHGGDGATLNDEVRYAHLEAFHHRNPCCLC
jgi:hypothetical protein